MENLDSIGFGELSFSLEVVFQDRYIGDFTTINHLEKSLMREWALWRQCQFLAKTISKWVLQLSVHVIILIEFIIISLKTSFLSHHLQTNTNVL